MSVESFPNSYILLLIFFFTIFFFTAGLSLYFKHTKHRATMVKIFIFFIIVGICAFGIKQSFKFSDRLDPILEPNEVYMLSAAYSYVDQGFDSNFGLPVYHYYDARKDLQWHVDQETKPSEITPQPAPPSKKKPFKIYTHLPPALIGSGGYMLKYSEKTN